MTRWSEFDLAAHRAGRATSKKNAKPIAREADVQQSIIDYLLLRGALVIRINSGGMKVGDRYVKFVRFPDEECGYFPESMKKSCSDLIAMLNGVTYAIEVKRAGEKATRSQDNFLAAVRGAGHVGIVAYSIDDVMKAIAVRKGE